MIMIRFSLSVLALILAIGGANAQDAQVIEEISKMEQTLSGLEGNHPDYMTTLNSLINLYENHGEYQKIIDIYSAMLGEAQKRGFEDSVISNFLVTLGGFYTKQASFTKAESAFLRALELSERAQGPDHPDLTVILNDLANVKIEQGLYSKAEPLLRRSIAIAEKSFGQNHINVARYVNNLANLYSKAGLHEQAEKLQDRALEITEKALGPDHLYVAMNLANLAQIYTNRGLYDQAEPLYRRALMITKNVLGPEHANVAAILNNLAVHYAKQGQSAKAEPLQRRSLEIFEKIYGATHPKVATGLNNLAMRYHELGLITKAESTYQRALAINEKVLGPNHPDVATTLNNIASLYNEQGLYAKAEPLIKRALAISEEALGKDHPNLATRLDSLASVYGNQGAFTEALSLQLRALAISEKSLGSDHPDVALRFHNLVTLQFKQGQFKSALESIRKASIIDRRRLLANLNSHQESQGTLDETGFRPHLDLLAKNKTSDSAEGFDLIQLIHSNPAIKAIAQSAARQWAPSPELSELVRRQQDSEQRYRHLDKLFIQAIGEPPEKQKPERVAQLRQEIEILQTEMAENRRRIAAQFPEYDTLVSSEPLTLGETQAMLRDDEALLAYAINDEYTHAVVVRKDSAAYVAIPMSRLEIDKLVRRVRATLLEPLSMTYDAEAAHALYRALFLPLQPHFKDAKNLLVVSEGSLSALPLGVLIETPVANETLRPQDYRHLNWLAKRHNFTTLPAVISLKALRAQVKSERRDQQPFFGMGDPVLQGNPGQSRGTQGKVVLEFHNLPALPDTADELRAVADALGASPDALFLREKATETELKQQPLERYRVLSLATHGLIAGEGGANLEPGLILTPPAKMTEADDGYLAASEVAQLKLNADWAVLSACNTAASDGTPGAAGLSGLARSFFYAGARSLLVSYWPVVSSAATRLITDTFRIHAADASVGKSEALRKAMLGMIEDEENPELAHPTFWSPFMVVGEGR